MTRKMLKNPDLEQIKNIKGNLPNRKFQIGNFLVWTLIGLLASTFSYVISSERGEESKNIVTVYLFGFSYFYAWAILTTVIYSGVKIIGVKTVRNLVFSIIFHFPLAIFLSFIHSFLYYSFVWILNDAFYVNKFTYSVQMRNFISIGNFIFGFIIYILIVITIQSILFFRNYREEEAKNLQLQNELTKAQLQTLKMQLQPHFLFNTLHSISSLNLADPHKANEMIARLGEFLRMTLENSDRQMVTLDEELKFVRHYLEIEQIRFSDRLEIEFNVDEKLLSAEVPHLILQPIVENAVKHGIAPFAENGRVNIKAETRGNYLIIKVTDHVSGRKIDALKDSNKKGKGLQNVRERLKQIYGENFSCEFCADAEKSEHITTLKIPFENDLISKALEN